MSPRTAFLPLMVLFLGLAAVSPVLADSGRVVVILDSSGSMSGAGTSMSDIKRTLIERLRYLPSGLAVGVRVFQPGGSRLVAPFDRNLAALERQLAAVSPGGGTYIGASLIHAAEDLVGVDDGDRHIFLITDGEGDPSDVQAAAHVRDSLLRGLDFDCDLIVYSQRRDVRDSTPIGAVADTLGCRFHLAGEDVSAESLDKALARVFSHAFYPFWLVLSALMYLVLLVLVAKLLFNVFLGMNVAPRNARVAGVVFASAFIPLVLIQHSLALFDLISMTTAQVLLTFGLVIASLLVMQGLKGRRGKHALPSRDPEDPFA